MAFLDNTTAIAYIKNQGGTRTRSLCDLSLKILDWVDKSGLTLSVSHVPGKLNVFADMLSRKDTVLHMEWSIHPQICLQIWRLWGRPFVDLFATSMNHKLDLYCSPLMDSHAWKVDALAHPWDGLIAYAYPPTSLLRLVLNKVKLEKVEIFLIAPNWPHFEWFADLINLLVDFPREIPPWQNLLKQPYKTCFIKSQNPRSFTCGNYQEIPQNERILLSKLYL